MAAFIRLENDLARAHRALWAAAQTAESLSDQGLADDLHEMLHHLETCQQEMLKGGRQLRLIARNRA